MPDCRRLGALTSFVAACLLLAACGGSGGGYGSGGSGGGGYSGAPYILASLVSFPTGAVPLGFVPPNFNTGASVLIQDSSSGAPIANASVSINGVALAYSVANQDYEGNIAVAPGDGVGLSVSVGGTIYAASGTQFTSYPTISAPLAAATWSSLSTNLVTWSGGAPTVNALYALGVLDSADPSGQLVWPSGNTIQVLPTSTTSFFINPNSLTAGGRLVIVGIADFVGIPNAAASSGIVISGFNYVPITVTDIPPAPSPATLVSIAVTPSNPSIANGASVQLTATGTYSD